jgi:3-oxoacyl-[acyl-carrier-protein] synthase-1
MHITAMTLSCAAGVGLPAVRAALHAARTGLRVNDFPHCDLKTWIGRVDGIEEICLGQQFTGWSCRNNQLAMLGLEQDQFMASVSSLKQRVDPTRIACIIGTTTAGISSTEAAYRALPRGQGFQAEYLQPRVHSQHVSASFVAEVLGLDGPVVTVSTACSSSAKVFANAVRLINSGWVDAAIVGGVDSLCLSVLYGFHSLELISNHPCQPFDLNRSGLSLGEAAGFAILERHNSANSQGRLLGFGESSDAHHMASPHPDGSGARAAMQQALDSAQLQPEQISYINCHGTATPLNDRIEAAAIKQVFPKPPPAASTKAFTGHTLGAAGITESILSLLALQEKWVPASLNCQAPEAEWADFILTAAQHMPVNYVLNNAFGFGGSNTSLLFGRA